MKYWGVQKRILLITLMPCLITAAALGSYFTYARISDLNASSISGAQNLARQAAMSASQWLQMDHNLLHQHMQMYLDVADVKAIALLNPKQVSLFRIGPKPTESELSQLKMVQDLHQLETPNSLRIRAPIYQRSASRDSSSPLLGWVELDFDHGLIHIQQYQATITALALVLLCTVFGLYLSLRASQRISQPLQGIAATLEQLESGNLDARIRVDSSNDFSMLASGINAMASSLQQAHQELQDNVEQATQDLKETLETLEVQNIELNMARKEALDASQTKSEFLANMSHEIRTPLNGILGFTKLLEKTQLSRRQQEYLHTIESSSSSLLTIINDILDFSKIEAGKLVLDKVPVQLRDVMDEVLTMLAPEAHKKGIELAAQIFHDIPHEFIGDPSRLKQVLTNLVSNAVKFTEQGSVIIRVSLEDEQGEQLVLKFSVIDTGIGLTDLQKENLFKAFSQADASTSRRFGGTGLGLVISKYLVDHMHGDIGVESASGVGSTFWFTGLFEASHVHTDHIEHYPWFDEKAYILCHRKVTGQSLQHQLMDLGFEAQLFEQYEQFEAAVNKAAPKLTLMEVGEIQSHLDMWQSLSAQGKVIALLPSNESTLLDYCQQQNIDRHLVFPVAQRRLTHTLQELFDSVPKPAHAAHATGADEPLRTVNVLAVDDNEPNLKLLTTWLQDLGVEVMRARGGKQAVSMASSHLFDLIFMDIQMPDMDGGTAGKIIGETTQNSKTPLVALTAHALPNERKQLLQDGFDDYLTKPISEEQLDHTLRKWTHYQGNPNSANAMQTMMTQASVQDSAEARLKAPLQAPLQASPSQDVVDISASLKLAGGKADLAEEMLQGLLEEITRLKPVLVAKEGNQLIEPVHKLHGLCRYVGVPKLRAAVEAAETCLKTDCAQWFTYRPALLQSMEDVERYAQDVNWQEQLKNSA